MTSTTRITLGYMAKYCVLVSLMILKFGTASDFVFTVHKTKACPKNQVEMDERSHALNCTKHNGYTCLPNENITVLLEFCYKRARIAVPKGLCLFLRYSDVDAYDCKRFIHGCPDADYFSDEIYEYPNCVSIGSGCFLADASCVKISAAYTSTATTFIKDLDENTHLPAWFWIVLPLCVLILLCTAIYIVYIIHKHKSFNRHRKKKTNLGITTAKRVNKSFNSDYASEKDEESIILYYADDPEVSSLNTVSDSSSFETGCTAPDKTFEHELDLGVPPSLNDIACQHEPNDSVRLLLHNTADVNLCANNGCSPSLSSSMGGYDTASLTQSDRRTSRKQMPIQQIMYRML